MKKLLILLSFLFCLNVRAEINVIDELKKLPTNSTGVFYNLNDSKFEFTSTFKVLGYKGFNLNAGFATENTGILSLNYEIINLENLGIELPILKDIVVDAGWSGGYKRIGIGLGNAKDNNEFVNGPNATLRVAF